MTKLIRKDKYNNGVNYIADDKSTYFFKQDGRKIRFSPKQAEKYLAEMQEYVLVEYDNNEINAAALMGIGGYINSTKGKIKSEKDVFIFDILEAVDAAEKTRGLKFEGTRNK